MQNREILLEDIGEDTGSGLKCVEDQRKGSGKVCMGSGLVWGDQEFAGHGSNPKLSKLSLILQPGLICLMPRIVALLLLSSGSFPRCLCHLKVWLLSNTRWSSSPK